MSFSIQCPHCGTKLKAKNKLIGKELPCPKCARGFVVQAPATPVAGAAGITDAAPAGNAELEPLGTNQADSGQMDLGQMDLGQMDLGSGDLGSLDLGAGDLGTDTMGSTDLGSFAMSPDPLGETSFPAPGPGAVVHAPSTGSTRRASRSKDKSKSQSSRSLQVPIIAAAVGGSVLLLLLVGGAIWLLMSSWGDAGPDADGNGDGSGSEVAASGGGAPAADQTGSLRAVRSKFTTNLRSGGPAPQEYDENVSSSGSCKYFAAKDVLLFGELQFPRGDGPFPAVVFCHGGFALGRGDVNDMRVLLNAGFAVFVPAWRGENGNPGDFELFLGEAEDAVAAMEYLTTEPRIDPENIFLAGHSAGATIAMLAAELSTIPRGAVAIGGMLDMHTYYRKSGKKLFEEIPFNFRDQAENRVRSPGQFIADLSCPIQLYYGEDEFPDSVKSAKAAVKQASKHDKRIEFIELEGKDHFTSLSPALQQGATFFKSLMQEKRQSPLPEPVDELAAFTALRTAKMPTLDPNSYAWTNQATEVSRQWESCVDGGSEPRFRMTLQPDSLDVRDVRDKEKQTVHRIEGYRPVLWNAAATDGRSTFVGVSPDGTSIAWHTYANSPSQHWVTLHSSKDFRFLGSLPDAEEFRYLSDDRALVARTKFEGTAAQALDARRTNRLAQELRFVNLSDLRTSEPITIRNGGIWGLTPGAKFVVISEPDEVTAKSLATAEAKPFNGLPASAELSVYAAASGQRVCHVVAQKMPSGLAMAFSEDGRELSVVGERSIGIWDLATGDVSISTDLNWQVTRTYQPLQAVNQGEWLVVSGQKMVHRKSGHMVGTLKRSPIDWKNGKVLMKPGHPSIEFPFAQLNKEAEAVNNPATNLLANREVELTLNFAANLDFDERAQAAIRQCIVHACKHRLNLEVVEPDGQPRLQMTADYVEKESGKELGDHQIYVNMTKQPEQAPAIKLIRDRTPRAVGLTLKLTAPQGGAPVWQSQLNGAEAPTYLNMRLRSEIQLSASSLVKILSELEADIPIMVPVEGTQLPVLPREITLAKTEPLPAETISPATVVPMNRDWLVDGVGGLPYRRAFVALHGLEEGLESQAYRMYLPTIDQQPRVVYHGNRGKAHVRTLAEAGEPTVIELPNSGSLQVSHQGGFFAYLEDKKALVLQDFVGPRKMKLELPAIGIAMAISPSSQLLAISILKEGVYVYSVDAVRAAKSLNDVQPLHRFTDAGQLPSLLTFSGDDQMLATAERNGDAFIWNLKTGIGFFQHKADGRANVDCALTGDGAYFYVLKSVHPNSRLYGNKQQPEVVEVDTKTLRKTRRLPHPDMISLHMSPRGGQMAIALATYRSLIVDVAGLENPRYMMIDSQSLATAKNSPSYADWSADGTFFAAANEKGHVTVWQMKE